MTKRVRDSIFAAMIGLICGMAFTSFAFQAAKSAPVLTAEQRESVRKFQLDDQRYENAIRQRQQEVSQLQQLQQQNAQRFRDYTAKLCAEPAGFQFDLTNDDLHCVEKPKPTTTPSPETKK